MLLPKKTNPSFSTYYCGAIVLKAFLESQVVELDFLELFRISNAIAKISMKSFALALDWLYLIGAIGVSKDSNLVLLNKNTDVPEAT